MADQITTKAALSIEKGKVKCRVLPPGTLDPPWDPWPTPSTPPVHLLPVRPCQQQGCRLYGSSVPMGSRHTLQAHHAKNSEFFRRHPTSYPAGGNINSQYAQSLTAYLGMQCDASMVTAELGIAVIRPQSDLSLSRAEEKQADDVIQRKLERPLIHLFKRSPDVSEDRLSWICRV